MLNLVGGFFLQLRMNAEVTCCATLSMRSAACISGVNTQLNVQMTEEIEEHGKKKYIVLQNNLSKL